MFNRDSVRRKKVPLGNSVVEHRSPVYLDPDPVCLYHTRPELELGAEDRLAFLDQLEDIDPEALENTVKEFHKKVNFTIEKPIIDCSINQTSSENSSNKINTQSQTMDGKSDNDVINQPLSNRGATIALPTVPQLDRQEDDPKDTSVTEVVDYNPSDDLEGAVGGIPQYQGEDHLPHLEESSSDDQLNQEGEKNIQSNRHDWELLIHQLDNPKHITGSVAVGLGNQNSVATSESADKLLDTNDPTAPAESEDLYSLITSSFRTLSTSLYEDLSKIHNALAVRSDEMLAHVTGGLDSVQKTIDSLTSEVAHLSSRVENMNGVMKNIIVVLNSQSPLVKPLPQTQTTVQKSAMDSIGIFLDKLVEGTGCNISAHKSILIKMIMDIHLTKKNFSDKYQSMYSASLYDMLKSLVDKTKGKNEKLCFLQVSLDLLSKGTISVTESKSSETFKEVPAKKVSQRQKESITGII